MQMSFAKEQPSRVAEIGIRRFQQGDAAAFRRLNEERNLRWQRWLSSHPTREPESVAGY